MARTPREERVRLNLLIGADSRERLERLMELTEADSMTEVIRRALQVYEHLLTRESRDGAVVVRSPDGIERELVLA